MAAKRVRVLCENPSGGSPEVREFVRFPDEKFDDTLESRIAVHLIQQQCHGSRLVGLEVVETM